MLALLLVRILFAGSIKSKQPNQEIVMNTQISSKLAALGLALMMNSLIIGGVAQLFSAHIDQRATTAAIDRATAQPVRGAA